MLILFIADLGITKMTHNNIPEGATHYIDDNKGFDYIRLDLKESWLDVWNSKFNCWLPIGYIGKSQSYTPIKGGINDRETD